jgi:hypothetical protein
MYCVRVSLRSVKIFLAQHWREGGSGQGCGSAFISSGFGSGISILSWIPIRIQAFNDQKLKKKLQLKKIEFFFWSKTTFYLFLGLQKKPSALKRGHPTLQNINFKKKFSYCGSFLPSWIRIHWPDWIQIQSGSGYATLVVGNLSVSISGFYKFK